MISASAHAANYARESKLKTMTVIELHAALAGVIAEGEGHLPVSVMVCDGLTHAVPIMQCIRSEPYDGDRVWIIIDYRTITGR